MAPLPLHASTQSFLNWVKSQLPEDNITNLFDAMHDGVLLLKLLRALSSSDSCPKAQRPRAGRALSMFAARGNIEAALQFMHDEGIKQDISPTSIYDGDVRSVLGLVRPIPAQ